MEDEDGEEENRKRKMDERKSRIDRRGAMEDERGQGWIRIIFKGGSNDNG